MDYNELIKELEKIILKLESGECGFEQSAQLYQQGIEISEKLGKQLDETKGKITILKKQMDKIIEEDFN